MSNTPIVVLIEPQIPQNTGNIMRLCACAGAELFLVGTLGFHLGDKFLRRAGMDYIPDVTMTHVATFEEVLAKTPGYTPFYASTKAKVLYTDVAYPPESMLVFGAETHGLPADWIAAHPETAIRIPMRPGARSLNLANSVAIVLYEVIRQGPSGL